MVLIKIGHAIIQVDRCLESFSQGEGSRTSSGPKCTIGQVIIPEVNLLCVDSSYNQCNTKANTNNR